MFTVRICSMHKAETSSVFLFRLATCYHMAPVTGKYIRTVIGFFTGITFRQIIVHNIASTRARNGRPGFKTSYLSAVVPDKFLGPPLVMT